MFSRESWCMVSISRAEMPVSPMRTPMVRSDGDIFLKNFGKMHRFWSLGLGLELQVSSLGLGLGVFDEVSVSSRNFNQVSVSVSKVTVSTTSLGNKQKHYKEPLHQANQPLVNIRANENAMAQKPLVIIKANENATAVQSLVSLQSNCFNLWKVTSITASLWREHASYVLVKPRLSTLSLVFMRPVADWDSHFASMWPN